MKILIVDDDELIANLVEQNLIIEGFSTEVCHDGVTALKLAEEGKPDLIILDIMLPGLDGFHVCRKLQGSGIPIIMLTSKSDISDKLMGLEMGADDYIVKPFDSRELVARVHTIFRRLAKASEKSSEISNPVKVSQTITVNEEARTAAIGCEELNLTPTEFNLLHLLVNNPGRVFTRAQLLDQVWGYDFLGDSRVVDIHIQRLRKKLGSYSSSIETAFGVGYRFKERKNEA